MIVRAAGRGADVGGAMDRTRGASMSGRSVLITGGTGGIGLATAVGLATRGARVAIAVGLAARGARVAIAGRDRQRASAAAREIGRAAASGAGVDVFVADLSDQAEVRRLAAEVLEALPHLDVLVNNVGGYWNTRHLTADGLERTFAVNHLAAFLLTNLLLDRLAHNAPARVVTVASNVQALGRIDFDDLQGAVSYSGARAYNQSKLANVLFTYELARRQPAASVTANALHPGVVRTSFGAEDAGLAQRLFTPVLRPFMKGPTRGAATSIHVAGAAELAGSSGGYFANSKRRGSAKRSYDETTAARLWTVSAELTGLPAVAAG
jgi:retinol dehydrogenase 14